MEVVHHRENLAALPVENALADFLLANWPFEQLEAAVASAGYTIEQTDFGRILLDNKGKLLVEVHKVDDVHKVDEVHKVDDVHKVGDHLVGSQPNNLDPVLRIIHHDVPLTVSIRTLQRQQIEP